MSYHRELKTVKNPFSARQKLSHIDLQGKDSCPENMYLFVMAAIFVFFIQQLIFLPCKITLFPQQNLICYPPQIAQQPNCMLSSCVFHGLIMIP
jgi:hypothetical protein